MMQIKGYNYHISVTRPSRTMQPDQMIEFMAKVNFLFHLAWNWPRISMEGTIVAVYSVLYKA